jgi:cellulose synthase/poly-beta-1,6-N-acetylglucosamine synthase-like glycosyltransferase
MKDSLIEQCLAILKRDDVKNELKTVFTPFINYILYELNPYIYIVITLVFLIFIMILTILFILLFMIRNKTFFNKTQ